jgi:hypothetical protein
MRNQAINLRWEGFKVHWFESSHDELANILRNSCGHRTDRSIKRGIKQISSPEAVRRLYVIVRHSFTSSETGYPSDDRRN